MNSWVLLLSIGLISGFFVGLIGIGAGMILIPGLTLAGMNMKQAITTALFLQVIPQTLPSVYLYYKKGHFKYEVSMIVLAGSIVGILIGSLFQYYNVFTERASYIILSTMLITLGVYNIYRNVLYPQVEKEVKKMD